MTHTLARALVGRVRDRPGYGTGAQRAGAVPMIRRQRGSAPRHPPQRTSPPLPSGRRAPTANGAALTRPGH
jgi:hypothetical protein